MRRKSLILWILLPALLLAACQSGDASGTAQPDNSGLIKVVATTGIVGDVVSQIGGEYTDLQVLLPSGTDPHNYSPTPQDAVMLSEAQVIFANGAGLETFLQSLVENAGASGRLVEVSDGIQLLEAADEGGHTGEDSHTGDPHTWVDPNNVMIWVDNIEQALSEADPTHSTNYQTNADAYRAQLTELDAWIREQVAAVPEENRSIVTDHMEQGYFADEYGFTLIGALIPGYSTLSEPSAKDLAQIEDSIRELGVKAVFVGNTINPTLAERVAGDTGTQLVHIYSGSLGPAGGEASTYLDYMRYNVNAIVGALK